MEERNDGIVLCANNCNADILIVDYDADEDGGYIIPKDLVNISYDLLKKEHEQKKLRRGDYVEIKIEIDRPLGVSKRMNEDSLSNLEFYYAEDHEDCILAERPDYFKDLQKKLSECIDAPFIIIKDNKALCPFCEKEIEKLSMGNHYWCRDCDKFARPLVLPHPASKEDDKL